MNIKMKRGESVMERFIAYLEDTTARLRQEEKELADSHRKDEADLMKVRINVYGICKTIFGVLDSEGYKKKLVGLRTSWSEAWEQAKIHGDVKKAVIEEIKLQTLREIEENYLESVGE